MGDYTSFQLTIYEIPNGAAEAVADLLNDNGLGNEWVTCNTVWDVDNVRKQVAAGEQFTHHNYRVGNSVGLTDVLVALEVPFQCWEDPMYEWLGLLYMYHPDLGLACLDCDASGQVVMSSHQLDIIDAGNVNDAEKWKQVVAFYGREWEGKFAEYREEVVG